MLRIRFHGRGGQGAVTASYLLANAFFKEGKWAQALPMFGVERRGAPVLAFVRVDEKPIRTRELVYEPDHIIVLDPTLLKVVDVLKGYTGRGVIVVNTKKEKEELGLPKEKLFTVDATEIALEVLGRPIVNTAMLGAFAKATGLVKLDSIIEAVEEHFPEELARKNVEAVTRAYEVVK